MAEYGLSVLNAGKEQLYKRQLLNLYYAVNIINPKAGSTSFTLPAVPEGSGPTAYLISPTRQPFDKVINMGGGDNDYQLWSFKNITISGRTVTIEVVKSAGGFGDLALTFYTDGG